MDPQATLQLILDSVQSGEWVEAREAVYNLRDWLARGGFVPTYSQNELNRVITLAGGLGIIDRKDLHYLLCELHHAIINRCS